MSISALVPALYDRMMASTVRGPVGELRRALARGIPGLVLEVGAGTGLGFSFYEPGARVVAIEPDVARLERARARADASPATIHLVAASAEALPFRDDAFDSAIVALAMCSIPDPGAALAEMRRAVRAGGPVRLLEHVRVSHPVMGRLQDWLTPIWRRVPGGCHLDRDTVGAVRASGLAVESVVPHWGGYVVEIAARAP